MTSRKRQSRERGRVDRPAGIDPVTDSQRHAATAVVLARVDDGTLTREGAYETLSMLGLVDEAEAVQQPPAW